MILQTFLSIKLFNLVALLDFPNFIGLNGSSSDGEISHFRGGYDGQKDVSTILLMLFVKM